VAYSPRFTRRGLVVPDIFAGIGIERDDRGQEPLLRPTASAGRGSTASVAAADID